MPHLPEHHDSPKSLRLYLILTLIAGGLLLSLSLDFQGLLSSGDHGRDLYAFTQSSHGAVPYQDYWWVYGPLMPFVYGLFVKVFGSSMVTILFAKSVIKLLGAVFLFWGAATIMPAIAAFLIALWYLAFFQDFFFTYNHIGGITMILGVMCGVLHYIRYNKIQHLWLAILAAFILCFIKVNFGLAALLAIAVGTGISDALQKPERIKGKLWIYISTLIVLPALTVGAYVLLVKGLSIAEIRQCLPYLSEDHPYNTTPLAAITLFVRVIIHSIKGNFFNIIVAVILNVSLIRLLYLFGTDALEKREQRYLLAVWAFLGIFYILNFHEFIKSGVWYRALWSHPISMLIMFSIIATAIKRASIGMRALTWGALVIVLSISLYRYSQHIERSKTPDKMITSPRGQVYVANDPHWVKTVNTTVDYINTLVGKEAFFALPYDPLYYYLTDHVSPTRQLIFFEHINIPKEQELSVIQDLENNNVNYVVISNRMNSPEQGLGRFGQTYCPILAQYIQNHFEVIAQIGDWTSPVPGWGNAHGTMILKRKNYTDGLPIR